MKIEEILSRLERIDHKEYSGGFEFADSSTFDEMGRCFEERKILAKEIERLNKALLDIKEYIEKDKASWEVSTFSQREDTTRVVFTKEAQDILNIVNKALGSDKEWN